MSESSDSGDLPVEIRDAAKPATSCVLPAKSKLLYDRQYDCFMKWCKEKEIHTFSEAVMLDYFAEKSKVRKSSSLWSTYSMLKSTLGIKENVDISKFVKLKAFLKRKSVGYIAEKAKTFTRQEVRKFLLEAPDSKYLMMKVTLLMGLAGACCRDELAKMTTDDVEDKESLLMVKIRDFKTCTQRTFTIPNKDEDGLNPAEICRKYVSLRPTNVEHRRFFLQYRSGKCTVQVVGVNQFAKIPRLVAKYLELPNPESYTGRTFRKSSATFLVHTGADILRLKRRGWNTASAAEGYLEECIKENVEIPNHFLLGKKNIETVGVSNVQDNYVLPSGSGDISIVNTYEPAIKEECNTESTISDSGLPSFEEINIDTKFPFVKEENEESYDHDCPSPSTTTAIISEHGRSTTDHTSRSSAVTLESTVGDVHIGEQYKNSQPEDKFDHFAKSLAANLREISKDQQIYALRLISEVIYEAQLGSLNRNTHLSLNNVPQSLPTSNTHSSSSAS